MNGPSQNKTLDVEEKSQTVQTNVLSDLEVYDLYKFRKNSNWLWRLNGKSESPVLILNITLPRINESCFGMMIHRCEAKRT